MLYIYIYYIMQQYSLFQFFIFYIILFDCQSSAICAREELFTKNNIVYNLLESQFLLFWGCRRGAGGQTTGKRFRKREDFLSKRNSAKRDAQSSGRKSFICRWTKTASPYRCLRSGTEKKSITYKLRLKIHKLLGNCQLRKS